MTPIEAGKTNNEKEVYSNLRDRKEIRKPMFGLGQLVCAADIKRVFSKGDSTNWSYNLCTITEVIHVTNPTSRNNCLPERYIENLLLPTKPTLDENNQVMKNLNLIQ